MFSIGEKVVYKHNAVCVVESVEIPSFAVAEGKEYYKLKFCYSKSGETVYVPKENCLCLRNVSSKQDIDNCFENAKTTSLPEFTARQPVVVGNHYQQLLSDYTLLTTLLVYKELQSKEKNLENGGKKLRQIEEYYLGMTEKAACEEIAACFDLNFDEAKEYLKESIA